MATWCHREVDNLAGPLTNDEKLHLDRLYQLYHLPYVISLGDYGDIAANVGFTHLAMADWSQQVEFFLAGRGELGTRSQGDCRDFSGGNRNHSRNRCDRPYDHRI